MFRLNAYQKRVQNASKMTALLICKIPFGIYCKHIIVLI